jgi:hypothetical protein
MGLVKVILANGKLVLLALLASCLAMGVSYTVVRQLAGEIRRDGAIDPILLQRARLLRTFSNDLVELCNTYDRRIPDSFQAVNTTDRRWIERYFRRDVQFLEQRMNDTMLGDVPVFIELRGAASKCASMGRHPEDALLREGALRSAYHAVEAVEAYIGGIGNGVIISPPRVPVRFDWRVE